MQIFSKASFPVLFLSLAITVSLGAQTADAPTDPADASPGKADKNDVRLLQVGHIVKIDEQKRTITIESPKESEERPEPFPAQGGPFGRRGRRGSYGRTRTERTDPNLIENLRTKIWITDATVVKEDGKTIPWNSLKKGDIIHVSGIAKKHDLEAKEIERFPHNIGG